jgi:hypothetical protein
VALSGLTSFTSFLAPVIPATGFSSGFLFDPRIVFSPWHDKFLMLILGLDTTNQKSYIFLAVSQTSSATGSWWLWRFEDTYNTDAWIDYASLGVDSWGVYFTGNEFCYTNCGSGAAGRFKHAIVWSVNPAVMTGGSASWWLNWNLQWPSTALAFGLQVAEPHSEAGDAATFFANTYSASGSELLAWKMTGDRTSSPTLVRAAIPTSAYNAIFEDAARRHRRANRRRRRSCSTSYAQQALPPDLGPDQ